MGVIEVADNALLLSEATNIYETEVVGLHVGSGAYAHYRYGEISQVAGVPTVPFLEYSGSGAAIHDATLEMSEFTIDHVALTGVNVVRSAVNLTSGVISHVVNGVTRYSAVTDPLRSPTSCLTSHVSFRSLGGAPFTDFDLPCFPDPCPTVPCASVPFECAWCTPFFTP